MARRSTERSPCSRQYSRSSGARKLDASVHVYTSSPASQVTPGHARSRQGLAFGFLSPRSAFLPPHSVHWCGWDDWLALSAAGMYGVC